MRHLPADGHPTQSARSRAETASESFGERQPSARGWLRADDLCEVEAFGEPPAEPRIVVRDAACEGTQRADASCGPPLREASARRWLRHRTEPHAITRDNPPTAARSNRSCEPYSERSLRNIRIEQRRAAGLRAREASARRWLRHRIQPECNNPRQPADLCKVEPLESGLRPADRAKDRTVCDTARPHSEVPPTQSAPLLRKRHMSATHLVRQHVIVRTAPAAPHAVAKHPQRVFRTHVADRGTFPSPSYACAEPLRRPRRREVTAALSGTFPDLAVLLHGSDTRIDLRSSDHPTSSARTAVGSIAAARAERRSPSRPCRADETSSNPPGLSHPFGTADPLFASRRRASAEQTRTRARAKKKKKKRRRDRL